VVFSNNYKRTKPLEDKTAKLFLDPSNCIGSSLVKGHSADEAYQSSQKAHRRIISESLTSESKKDNQTYLPYLFWDMRHQICLGNKEAFS